MGRQMKYPMVYPDANGQSSAQAAWDFLLYNQGSAPEACMVWFENELERVSSVRVAKSVAKSNNKSSVERADWQGYANIELGPNDKLAIRGGVLDGESVLDIIGDMLGTGHKVAMTYDPDKDTVTAAATGVYKTCKNAGYTLTCFARTVTDVLTVLAYKHEVIAKGDWSKFTRIKREADDLG